MNKVGLVLIGFGMLQAALASADCTVQLLDAKGAPVGGVNPSIVSGSNGVNDCQAAMESCRQTMLNVRPTHPWAHCKHRSATCKVQLLGENQGVVLEFTQGGVNGYDACGNAAAQCQATLDQWLNTPTAGRPPGLGGQHPFAFCN